jgi:hypothetical protein
VQALTSWLVSYGQPSSNGTGIRVRFKFFGRGANNCDVTLVEPGTGTGLTGRLAWGPTCGAIRRAIETSSKAQKSPELWVVSRSARRSFFPEHQSPASHALTGLVPHPSAQPPKLSCNLPLAHRVRAVASVIVAVAAWCLSSGGKGVRNSWTSHRQASITQS